MNLSSVKYGVFNSQVNKFNFAKKYSNLAPLAKDTISFKGNTKFASEDSVNINWIDDKDVCTIIGKIDSNTQISSTELSKLLEYFNYTLTRRTSDKQFKHKYLDAFSIFTVTSQNGKLPLTYNATLKRALKVVNKTGGELLFNPLNKPTEEEIIAFNSQIENCPEEQKNPYRKKLEEFQKTQESSQDESYVTQYSIVGKNDINNVVNDLNTYVGLIESGHSDAVEEVREILDKRLSRKFEIKLQDIAEAAKSDTERNIKEFRSNNFANQDELHSKEKQCEENIAARVEAYHNEVGGILATAHSCSEIISMELSLDDLKSELNEIREMDTYGAFASRLQKIQASIDSLNKEVQKSQSKSKLSEIKKALKAKLHNDDLRFEDFMKQFEGFSGIKEEFNAIISPFETKKQNIRSLLDSLAEDMLTIEESPSRVEQKTGQEIQQVVQVDKTYQTPKTTAENVDNDAVSTGMVVPVNSKQQATRRMLTVPSEVQKKSRKAPVHLTITQAKEISKLYHSGVSPKEIAEQCGISISTVHRYKNFNLKNEDLQSQDEVIAEEEQLAIEEFPMASNQENQIEEQGVIRLSPFAQDVVDALISTIARQTGIVDVDSLKKIYLSCFSNDEINNLNQTNYNQIICKKVVQMSKTQEYANLLKKPEVQKLANALSGILDDKKKEEEKQIKKQQKRDAKEYAARMQIIYNSPFTTNLSNKSAQRSAGRFMTAIRADVKADIETRDWLSILNGNVDTQDEILTQNVVISKKEDDSIADRMSKFYSGYNWETV